MLNVGISQRGGGSVVSDALLVFRNFTQSGDRYSAQFTVTAVDGGGEPIPNIPPAPGLVHGSTFTMPGGALLNLKVEQTSGEDQGDTQTLLVQPYTLIAPEYDIFHFYHEQNTETVWAIGSLAGNPRTVCVLKSTDYFATVQQLWTETILPSDPNYGQYRSIYVDQYGNVIIGWRPGPLISRDGGNTFQEIGFDWLDPFHGILCPFWNITEDDSGKLVISEYGDSLSNTQPHGSHRGTFWSSDPQRMQWVTRKVDAGFDSSDPNKFSGYFRHIHGYHIDPEMPNIHHMFLGDPAMNQSSDGTPGYYVSQDGGNTWSTEILVQYANSHGMGDQFFNGPCFVTWWPGGKAFITSDTADTGHAFWWGTGTSDWGGPSFGPAIELHNDVDEESQSPDTPWMGVAVSETETYCVTSTNGSGAKEIVWRYNSTSGAIQVIAETLFSDPTYSTLRWLSASRHNRIPEQAKFFFTSGNRRFPRL